jgi:hypothetical protein
MRPIRALLLLLVVLAPIGFTACDQDGPAEKAGEKIDNAVDDAKDAVEDDE